MNPARRIAIAAASIGLTLLQLAAVYEDPAFAASNAAADRIVADLIKRSEASNAALMRGEADRYRALVSYTHDFTLMSPFGGAPSRAAEYTPERIQAMGRFFRNGTFEQEVVQAYGSPDMVVLALIERQRVEVGGLPAQDWPLRVTLVYRREGSEWRLAHRHADPLVERVSLEHAAALARGERIFPTRM